MGANPHNQHYAIRWDTGRLSNSYATEAEARRVLNQFHGKGKLVMVNPLPLGKHPHRRRNPVDTAEAAREVREGFVDDESNHYIEVDEPHVPKGNYAQLGTGGKVVDETNGRYYVAYLAIKPVTSIEVKQIDLRSPKIIFISSVNRRQIYIVGAVNIDADDLRDFNANANPHGEVYLGEARQIGYIATKYHPEAGNDAAGQRILWDHKFGEESGILPKAYFDSIKCRLILRGGNYRVEDAGIID